MQQRLAAVHESGHGPNAKRVRAEATSGQWGKAEEICSDRVLLFVTDAVEKGFFSFDRVRLIQDQAQARNVDSKNQSSRFDCCVFLFHSFRAVTFSTASARNRLGYLSPTTIDSSLVTGSTCRSRKPASCIQPISCSLV